MNMIVIIVLLLLSTTTVRAQDVMPPEIVKLENVLVEGDMKSVYVGNANNHYMLFCNTKSAGGCITPAENKNYLLFDSKTRWKLPGAKDYMTLSWIQDWTVKYNQGENVGLILEQKDESSSDLGLFLRDANGGGYEQNVVVSDGPIIYGTGMSASDSRKAWKHFFLQMVKSAELQQGRDAVGVKLARRCQPGENFCTIMLDADIVGIGGIKEPRKVLVVITTDIKDQSIQLLRSVCTYPAKGTVICRDFDTGKLISAKHAEQ